MVFRADDTRRVANSLLTLFDQVDQAYPGRAKGNDGTIGDEAHQQTDSDHNPQIRNGSFGVITALDITHDPAHGFDAGVFAETLRLNRDRRIKYVIFNGRIFNSTQSPWIWRDRNKGPGDHSEHVHISVVADPVLYDNTLPWAIDSLPIKPSAPGLPLESGRGSWYSQFSGKYQWVDTGDEPGSAALGVPDDAQGISFYDHSTIGNWFEVHYPNGAVSIEQQTDIGPNPKTGRVIDISAAAAERAGYTPRNFPTDLIFSWRPVAAPAVVAGLSPPQQATRYRDLRTEKPMAEQTDLVTIAKSIQDLVGSIATLKMEVATLRSLVTGVKPPETPVDPPVKPPVVIAPPTGVIARPDTDPLKPVNFGSLIASVLAMIVAPATGVSESIDKGTLGSLIPVATAVASGFGLPGWVLPLAGQLIGRITGANK